MKMIAKNQSSFEHAVQEALQLAVSEWIDVILEYDGCEYLIDINSLENFEQGDPEYKLILRKM